MYHLQVSSDNFVLDKGYLTIENGITLGLHGRIHFVWDFSWVLVGHFEIFLLILFFLKNIYHLGVCHFCRKISVDKKAYG